MREAKASNPDSKPPISGDVTLDFGKEGRVNVRVQTHPFEPGGSFISKPCPEAAFYNLSGVVAGTPQASVDAQVSLGWSFNSSENSGPESWNGWFTGYSLGIGPYAFSVSLGDGWFSFSYGVGGGVSVTPGITFSSFATYYDLEKRY